MSNYTITIESDTNSNIYNQVHYECDGPVCGWGLSISEAALSEEYQFYYDNQFDFDVEEVAAELARLEALLDTIHSHLDPGYRDYDNLDCDIIHIWGEEREYLLEIGQPEVVYEEECIQRYEEEQDRYWSRFEELREELVSYRQYDEWLDYSDLIAA